MHNFSCSTISEIYNFHFHFFNFFSSFQFQLTGKLVQFLPLTGNSESSEKYHFRCSTTFIFTFSTFFQFPVPVNWKTNILKKNRQDLFCITFHALQSQKMSFYSEKVENSEKSAIFQFPVQFTGKLLENIEIEETFIA